MRLTAVLLVLATLIVGFEIARLPDVEHLIERVATSTVLLDREGQPLRYCLARGGLLAARVLLEAIHSAVVKATLAAEDARFRSHHGVDGPAVLRAVVLNVVRRRIVSGASTISMQVARLLRPLPRSYYGKFREAILAIHLERALGKDTILELYFQLAPYGGNLHGIEAAARRYFGRGCGDLSLSEAALLAGQPQLPTRLRPDRNPEGARRRRNWILDRMRALELIGESEWRRAKSAQVNVSFHPLPMRARHFADWALGRVPQGQRVVTTLDVGIQDTAQSALRKQLEVLEAEGVRNGTVVIAETETGKIRAFVGSQDYSDRRDGQVNGVVARRSPGSLLKPFVYGMAFESGTASPQTILHDEPLSYRDGYGPQNFDRRYRGPVTAHQALVHSLNTPAVDLLERVGVDNAIRKMRSFGLSIGGNSDRSGVADAARKHGLSLVLGGAEVSLFELVETYATLGRLGRHRTLTFREDAPSRVSTHVLERRAAYELAQILADASWPGGDTQNALRLPRVALKTGTSFGLRDAWALAFTPSWTVGVWIGNFNGEPSAALVGRKAAAPVALEILRDLARTPVEDRPHWYQELPPRASEASSFARAPLVEL
jgi:penicillin-binding protein 1C